VPAHHDAFIVVDRQTIDIIRENGMPFHRRNTMSSGLVRKTACSPPRVPIVTTHTTNPPARGAGT
jgi:hypothetical protein